MVEMQDVFLQYGTAYKQNHKLSFVQHKTFKAICDCRTSVLGGHNDVCPNCGVVKQSYNSCRNRIAISNNRILSCENGYVTFKWRDYRDCNNKPPFAPLLHHNYTTIANDILLPIRKGIYLHK